MKTDIAALGDGYYHLTLTHDGVTFKAVVTDVDFEDIKSAILDSQIEESNCGCV